MAKYHILQDWFGDTKQTNHLELKRLNCPSIVSQLPASCHVSFVYVHNFFRKKWWWCICNSGLFSFHVHVWFISYKFKFQWSNKYIFPHEMISFIFSLLSIIFPMTNLHVYLCTSAGDDFFVSICIICSNGAVKCLHTWIDLPALEKENYH